MNINNIIEVFYIIIKINININNIIDVFYIIIKDEY